jgi:hypothetical protein
MPIQPREGKIFAALLTSITAGAIILMALGNNPPPAGAFSLSDYYHLDPVENVILSRAAQRPNRWRSIEIYYSGTKAGNIKQLTSLNGLAGPEDINCHFVLCNGLGGNDGQIQTTEKWQRQWSCIPGRTWFGNENTIRICLIADGQTCLTTNFQTKRAEALIELLSRKFYIPAKSIYFPENWQ